MKEWLANERILCYRFFNTDRVTIDSWFDDILLEMNRWSQDRRWRLMLDLCHEDAVMSAYMVNRIKHVSVESPQVRGQIAMVVPNKVSARIAALTIRTMSTTSRYRLVFHNEQDALMWLLETKTRQES